VRVARETYVLLARFRDDTIKKRKGGAAWLPPFVFRVDNFESVLGGGFVMMAVAFYAAAVFPMMTIMRGRLVGGLCLGETRTILWCLLHGGSLRRTNKRHS